MPRPALPTQPSLLARPGKALIHRDLSWLQFNERVLAEARDRANPTLERLKFLAISASNLDEFFMIRVSTVAHAIREAERHGNAREAKAQKRIRTSLFKGVLELKRAQDAAFAELSAELNRANVHLITRLGADPAAHALAREVFEREVFPHLEGPQPLQAARLAQAGNLSLLAIFDNDLFVHVPRTVPAAYLRTEPATGRAHVFLLDWLILAFLGPALHLQGIPGLVRVTRDGDVTADLDEAGEHSPAERVRSSLSVRERGRPVRLQTAPNAPVATIERVRTALKLEPAQVFAHARSLCLHGLFGVTSRAARDPSLPRALFYPPYEAPVPRGASGGGDALFARIRQGDLLLHHPYDAFSTYERFVADAARDPRVRSIDQTIYRVDPQSPLVESLKEAARTKRVRVAIELRARFDELNNLRLADELRQAGVEVVFGFGGLKLHAKVALVTREEPEGLRRYTHLSTGNYNAATARTYTDLSVLTAHPDIGEDADHFFTAVAAGRIPGRFRALVPAPTRLHRRMLALIETETQAAGQGRSARIVAKMNALVDEAIIDALYRASQAGVRIDLIVRGPCSLIPGVRGLSENVRVISVVDRFLEHSRLYYFESSETLYLSSADWMPRNFFSRLELAFPVLDPRVFRYLRDVFIPAYFADHAKARELTSAGTWRRRPSRGDARPSGCQDEFQRLAKSAYEGTPLASS